MGVTIVHAVTPDTASELRPYIVWMHVVQVGDLKIPGTKSVRDSKCLIGFETTSVDPQYIVDYLGTPSAGTSKAVRAKSPVTPRNMPSVHRDDELQMRCT